MITTRTRETSKFLEDYNRKAEGHNPLCGDNVSVYLKVNDAGNIEDVSFKGSGCAISKASASLMTTILKGKTPSEAHEVFDLFHKVVTAGPGTDANVDDELALGKLAVFAGVRDYPARVKCASLAWHAVAAALDHQEEPVTTE